MSVQIDPSKGISEEQEKELRARYSKEHVDWLMTQVEMHEEAETVEEPAPATAPEDTYGNRSNEQLREELARRGLKTSGNKDEMIARLEEHDAGDGADEDGEQSES